MKLSQWKNLRIITGKMINKLQSIGHLMKLLLIKGPLQHLLQVLRALFRLESKVAGAWKLLQSEVRNYLISSLIS